MYRLAAFLDFQNVYNGARRVFFGGVGPSSQGNVYPHKLGALLESRALPGAKLTAVNVYRGLPDAGKDPKGNAAARRQQAAHEAAAPGLVKYHVRPLLYPRGWPQEKAQEKGVDVALAVDFMSGAGRDYDLGVILSTDTDLRPALEAVKALAGNPYPRPAVAAWRAPAGAPSPRLHIDGYKLWCFWLQRPDFDAVADATNYTLP